MKRFMGLVMIMSVLLQNVGGYSASGDEIISEEEMVVNGSVISEELREAMDAGIETDTYRVMVWTDDIDYDAVEQMAETTTGTSWESLEANEAEVYAEALDELVQMKVESGELAAFSTGLDTLSEEERMLQDYTSVYSLASDEMSLVQAEVDELVMAEREAAVDLYEVNNQVLTDNELIKENIEFVSRYSPMVIVELSREQIEELAENDAVVGIYLCEDEVAVEEDLEVADEDELTGEITEETAYEGEVVQEVISLQVDNTVTISSADEDYTAYLDYLDVTSVHGMTLTGKNSKVGIVDTRQVYYTDHTELNGSNIIQVGRGSQMDIHGVNMARVICGSNGVAPDCILYSAYQTQTDGVRFFSSIEMLLDAGVSIINLSGYHYDAVYGYNSIEMWYDHISVNHGVLVVKSAGNQAETQDEAEKTWRISSPGLAYNVLTVGNVNCFTDELEDTSCYVNDSYTKKPDVVSAGEGVLDLVNGGTSAATATVTGIIALILEAKPSLAGKPHIIKAIVVASADHIAGSDSFPSGYTEKQGAGVVNAFRAIMIVSRGQYYGNYTSTAGTITLTKSVSYGSTDSSFAFVATKMNVGTENEHTSTSYSNCDMPEINLVVLTGDGALIGTSTMSNSSVEVVHGSYSSEVQIKLIFSTMTERGAIYGVAWY